MNEFKIEQFLREENASVKINQIGFAELCKLVKADGLMPNQSTRFGTRIFLTSNDERVQVKGKNFSAIRLGKSVMLDNDLFSDEPKECVAAIKQLINDHVVYYGEAEGTDAEGEAVTRTWISFGKKGELVPGKVYSLKDLAKGVGAIAGM